MRILLVISILILRMTAFAQTSIPIQMGSKYYEFKNAVRVDSALFIPRKDTLFTDNTLKAPGMILWRPVDSSFYIFNGVKWNVVLSSSGGVAIDSAYRSNDTLFFRKINGGYIAVFTGSILNQYAAPQNARAWISGHLRADSGILVKRNFTGLGDKIGINVLDSTTSGNIELGNATFAANQFMPYIAGTIRYDSASLGTSTNRSLYFISRYYAVDTTSRSLNDKNFILSSGGSNFASKNLNDITNGRVSKASNLFSVSKTLSPTAVKLSMRIGGDDNTQFAGKLAVGYPFALNDTTSDDLMTYMQRFKTGQVLKVNGRATAAAAVDTNDLVIKRQLDDWQNFQITNLLSEAAIPIQPNDSLVTALGKLQAQINNGGGASLQSATTSGNTTTLSASFGSSITPFKSVHAWGGLAFPDSSYLTGASGIVKVFTKSNAAGAIQTGSLSASSTYAITQPAAGSAYIQNQLMVGNNVPLGGIHVVGGVVFDDSTKLRGNSGPNPYASFLTYTNAAATVKMGGLVVASSYTTVPPTNGAYIQGNVGIGTSSVSNRLHVAGAIRLDNGSPGLGKIPWDTTGTGVMAWRKGLEANGSAVTFSPVANVTDILGTGYSVTVTGTSDHLKITITTGTGMTTNGTIGNIVLSTAFSGVPTTVYSASDVGSIGAPVGFNATSSSNIIIFSSAILSPSKPYYFNLISTL